jgi:hypothetical protein
MVVPGQQLTSVVSLSCQLTTSVLYPSTTEVLVTAVPGPIGTLHPGASWQTFVTTCSAVTASGNSSAGSCANA